MRQFFKPTGPLPVSDLKLDVNNFRFEPQNTQSDCIRVMLEDDRSHLMEIAKDIAEVGLMPDPIVLFKDKDGTWVVREGNRRVACLKMLNNPACVPLEKEMKKIKDLAEKFDENIPSKIDCIYSDNEEAILEYLDRLHTGAKGGIGRIGWLTENKSRYEAYRNRTSKADLAVKAKTFAEENGAKLNDNYSITNLQRVLNDQKIQKILRMKWEDGEISFGFDGKLAGKLLTELVKKIGDVKVSEIYDTGKREKYILKLLKNLGIDPDKHQTPYEKIYTQKSKANDESEDSRRKGGRGQHGTSRPSWKRKRVVNSRSTAVNIPQNYKKPNKVLSELSRGIEVEYAPFGAAVLLRAIIEYSVDRYLTVQKITPKEKLATRTKQVVTDLYKKGKIDKSEHNVLNRLANGQELFSIQTLHSVVHDVNYYPDRQTINTFWDNIENFISKCWK